MASKFTKITPYKPINKYHISKGNTKIGSILNTNLQAGSDYICGRTTEQGACVGCCEECNGGCEKVCYARSAYRYDNVIIANSDNTHFARNDSDGFFKAVKEKLERSRCRYHRWHSSGEILSPEYLKGMVKIAEEVKSKQHYVYTKRYTWINDYLQEIGGREKLPENFSILLSPPFGCDTKEKVDQWAKENNPHRLPLFIYDAGKDDGIKALAHCPAVDQKGHKTGITCDKCQRCIKGMTTAVYAH